MGLRCLAMTGVPGWLTQALLDDLRLSPLDGISEIRAFVHPALLPSSAELRKRNPTISCVHGLDLGQSQAESSQKSLDGIDVLVHSAAMIHVRRTADWYRVNTEGTLRLAEAARAAGIRRFVFISSNAAGGRCDSCDHTLVESDSTEPLSHYGKSKRLAEQGLLKLHNPNEFEVVILRPSMFYGPPVPDRHIEVYRRVLAGTMPMIGSGEYRRSITYIDNLVQATRLAMTHPAAPGEIFYVVDEPVYTTRAITEAMASALNVPFKVLQLPAILGPVAYWTDRALASAGVYWQNLHLVGESHWHVALSCEKLKQRLGYSPRVELAEGMRRAVEWCRSNAKL
jgi:nucleoside-diphosphate-sugar epimerase